MEELTPEEWDRLERAVLKQAEKLATHAGDDENWAGPPFPPGRFRADMTCSAGFEYLASAIDSAAAELPECVNSRNFFRFVRECVFPLSMKVGVLLAPQHAKVLGQIEFDWLLNHIGRHQSRLQRSEESRLSVSDLINLRLARATERQVAEDRLRRTRGLDAENVRSVPSKVVPTVPNVRPKKAGSSKGGRPLAKHRLDAVKLRRCRGGVAMTVFARLCSVDVDTLRNAEKGKRVSENTWRAIAGHCRRKGLIAKDEELLVKKVAEETGDI